jgi:hypothetical protein
VISISWALTLFLLRLIAFRCHGKGTSCSMFPYRDSQQVKIFLFSTASKLVMGPTQPPIQWVPGVKRPGRAADRSPQSSAEVKNGVAIPGLPTCLHDLMLN